MLIDPDPPTTMSPNNTTETDKAIEEDTMAPATKKTVVLNIAVGSGNPCKINAVKAALQQVIGSSSSVGAELNVEGFDVQSGVPDQPFGDGETQDGAKNRAENAYQAFKAKNGHFPHLSIGLEGGLEWSSAVKDDKGEDTLWCMAWMAIYGDRRAELVDLLASKDCKVDVDNEKNIFGLAKTGSFLLPSNLGKLIKEGMELGDADDKVFGRIKAKHGSGTVGLLTNGLIDRSAYYEHALILALVPWIRADVYA